MNLKLPEPIQIGLGALLTAAEAVQVNLGGMSGAAHAGMSMFIVILAAIVVKGATPAQIQKALTPQTVTIIGGVLGALLIMQQSFHVGTVVHTVIAIIAVVAASFGIAPTAEIA